MPFSLFSPSEVGVPIYFFVQDLGLANSSSHGEYNRCSSIMKCIHPLQQRKLLAGACILQRDSEVALITRQHFSLVSERSVVPFCFTTTLDFYLHILCGARVSHILLKNITPTWHQLPVYALWDRKARSDLTLKWPHLKVTSYFVSAFPWDFRSEYIEKLMSNISPWEPGDTKLR